MSNSKLYVETYVIKQLGCWLVGLVVWCMVKQHNKHICTVASGDMNTTRSAANCCAPVEKQDIYMYLQINHI